MNVISHFQHRYFGFCQFVCTDLVCQVSDFSYLGRIHDNQSRVREAMFQSKQMGKRENKIINIEGRVQFDLLQVRPRVFVTLPPEMSQIATWSLYGYSQFRKGGAVLSILAFHRKRFLQSFLHHKMHFLHTRKVYKCHYSKQPFSKVYKCLKQATLQYDENFIC